MKNIFRFCAAVLWIAALLYPYAALSDAGELASKMEGSAKGLVKEAEGKNLSGVTLAVFPFQTDETLAKKRVNFAVSELYLEQLNKTGTFKPVERMQLDAVLKEQKVGLSGAVDSETAAKVGKVLGARLLLIGSVARMGNSYQISARLIDSDNSQIVASDIVEVPISVFDEEAARYITLVPEKEALGLYLALRSGGLKESRQGPQAQLGATATAGKADIVSIAVGLGARYWFTPAWMLDAAYFPTAYEAITSFTTSAPVFEEKPKISATQIRVVMHKAWRPSEKWRVMTGAGVSVLGIGSEWPDHVSTGGVEISRLASGDHNTIVSGILRLGGEWRPKTRVGFGIFADMNVGAKEYKNKAEFKTTAPLAAETAVLAKYKLPAVTVEANLSINF